MPLAPHFVDPEPDLRTWAGCLHKPISSGQRQALKQKAIDEGKTMVKVTVNKTTGKKQTTQP